MHQLSLMRTVSVASLAVTTLSLSPAWASPGGDDPFADQWIAYEPGENAAKGFTDPQTSLGSPERFTGEGIFPGVVSAFNPAFGTDEIVSIGRAETGLWVSNTHGRVTRDVRTCTSAGS